MIGITTNNDIRYTLTIVLKLILVSVYLKLDFVPKGIRTPVAAVKGRCPRPLDDGDLIIKCYYTEIFYKKII